LGAQSSLLAGASSMASCQQAYFNGFTASSPTSHVKRHARSRSSSRDSRDARRPWR
jgi:hypothetical protein